MFCVTAYIRCDFSIVMSSVPPMYINMERVGRNSDITHTGWPYIPTEKVSALLRKTKWFSYKLAIGVSTGMFGNPLKLRWTTKQLKAGEYDPSLGELFDGISLDQGQSYFLMVSNLHEGLKGGSAYTMDLGNLSHNRYLQEALWRYRQLYMPPSPLWPHEAATRPTGPSHIVYIRQPSDKRPAETPPDDEPGAKRRMPSGAGDASLGGSQGQLECMSQILLTLG